MALRRGGQSDIAQVDRQGCSLILADTQFFRGNGSGAFGPEKIGKGLMFISLNVEPATREAAVAALDALRAELEAKGVPVKEGSWGYRLLVVDDPDGNQLFFNYPDETVTWLERSIIVRPRPHLQRCVRNSPQHCGLNDRHKFPWH